MPEITMRHEIDCDVDTFWDKCVFSEDFNRRLYVEVVKVKSFEHISDTDEPTRRTRKVKIDPQVHGMPGPVKKLLGDRFSYVEEGVFDKATKRYTFKITPSTLTEKTKVSGDMFCEPRGEGKMVRISKVSVEVKVFAVGGLVEDKIVSDLKVSFDASAKFTSDYVREKGFLAKG